MGSLALSMPPAIRNGRPSLDAISTTQLLGGSSEEDMILGHHISARLAKRIGCPIFVSCSLSGWGGDSGGNIAVGGGGGGGQGAAPEMSLPALSAGYDDSLQQLKHSPILFFPPISIPIRLIVEKIGYAPSEPFDDRQHFSPIIAASWKQEQ